MIRKDSKVRTKRATSKAKKQMTARGHFTQIPGKGWVWISHKR